MKTVKVNGKCPFCKKGKMIAGEDREISCTHCFAVLPIGFVIKPITRPGRDILLRQLQAMHESGIKLSWWELSEFGAKNVSSMALTLNIPQKFYETFAAYYMEFMEDSGEAVNCDGAFWTNSLEAAIVSKFTHFLKGITEYYCETTPGINHIDIVVEPCIVDDTYAVAYHEGQLALSFCRKPFNMYWKTLDSLLGDLEGLCEVIASNMAPKSVQKILFKIQDSLDPSYHHTLTFEVIDPSKWQNGEIVDVIRSLTKDYCKTPAGRQWFEDCENHLNWSEVIGEFIESDIAEPYLANYGLRLITMSDVVCVDYYGDAVTEEYLQQ